MPSSTSLTSSFPVGEPAHEVICPLLNSDGSPCRKRCTGEKRYRSIIEHIRRSHPNNYIPKLPATEESLYLMVNSPPRELDRPHGDGAVDAPGLHHPEDRDLHHHHGTAVASLTPAASAAAALAQLHNHRYDQDWDSDNVGSSFAGSPCGTDVFCDQDWMSDTDGYHRLGPARSSIEIPPYHAVMSGINNAGRDPTSDPYNHLHHRKDLSSLLSNSPPGRSSTLPPIQRHPSGTNRPRKQSISKRAREPPHRRQKSRDHAHLRRMSYERKAYSAEPSSALSAAYGKRWEDLIDAATSATEDAEGERTPVPPSPLSMARSSLPPTTLPSLSANAAQPTNTYHASPLNRALTPPSQSTSAHDLPEPFPTIESASTLSTSHTSSGEQFHISAHGLSSSSPAFSAAATASTAPSLPQTTGSGNGGSKIQIYCAACQNISLLNESYACTECICGICRACVDVLVAERGERRKCPRCRAVGGRFKPFQLDVR